MTSTRMRKLGAGITFVVLALSTPSFTRADAPPEAVAEKEAREHFKAGVRHLQDPDGARYEDAYREFRAAYGASPNPKILGNIGFCAMKLERDGEAIDAYTRYLAEVADIDPDERDQISKDLQAMRSGVVRITVSVAMGTAAATLTDTRTPITGAPIVNTYGPIGTTALVIGLRPGRHVLRVKVPGGGESQPWELDASPGTKGTHVFSIAKAEDTAKSTGEPSRVIEEPSGSRTVPWLVTAVGGAMLVSGAVTGIIVLNKINRLESRCPNDVCPTGSGLEGERDSITRLTRATDVLLVGGAVLTTTGFVWLLLSGGKSSSSEGAPAQTATVSRPDLACTGLGCTFTVTGRF